MKVYWTTTGELAKSSPEIFCYNIKEKGMFIGVPGTLIFRTRQEAEKVISEAKKLIRRGQI